MMPKEVTLSSQHLVPLMNFVPKSYKIEIEPTHLSHWMRSV